MTLHVEEQHGDPAEVIELHANAREVDLIVMGAEGAAGQSGCGGPRSREQTIRRSKRPTLVVSCADNGSNAVETRLLPLTCHPADTLRAGAAVSG